MKKVLVAVLIAVLACGTFALAGCSQGASSSSSTQSSSSAASSTSSSSSASSSSASKSSSASSSASTSYVSEVPAGDQYGSGVHHAVVTVDGYDPFTIELNADEAPVTVWNFCTLANDGFYNGLTFYRFVDGFCMQGGSSNNSAAIVNDGLTPIIGEFAGNNVDNKLASDFGKGTVAMARSSDPNGATSTFFVTLDSGSMVSQSLNDLYAAFGTIDADGMATVDKIVADYLPNVTDASSGAIDDEADQARITSIEVID